MRRSLYIRSAAERWMMLHTVTGLSRSCKKASSGHHSKFPNPNAVWLKFGDWSGREHISCCASLSVLSKVNCIISWTCILVLFCFHVILFSCVLFHRLRKAATILTSPPHDLLIEVISPLTSTFNTFLLIWTALRTFHLVSLCQERGLKRSVYLRWLSLK